MSNSMNGAGKTVLIAAYLVLLNSALPCPTPPNADAKVVWTGLYKKVEYVPPNATLHFSAICGSCPENDFSYDPDNFPPGQCPYPGVGITNYKWEYSKDSGPWNTFANSPQAHGVEYSFAEDGQYSVRLTVTDDDDPSQTDTNTCTVYVVVVDSVEWVAMYSPLDTNENPGAGKRIYPGKVTPSDTKNRRKVKVRASLNVPVADWTVYFKAFDIDDPFDNSSPIDSNGSDGGDNRGGSGSLSATTDYTDASGTAEVQLTVTMQPGDNFRVGAHVGSLSSVTDDDGPANNNPEVPGQPGKYTQMLTVWRKLHTEVDSMGAPPPGTTWGPDDVVVSDVPDPDTGLFELAFQDAYVSPVFDTGNDNSNAAFVYNLTDLATQGSNNRGTTAESSDFWVAYIQGAYEGNLTKDNDPDGEVAVAGIYKDSGPEYAFVFIEVIRVLCVEHAWDQTVMERRTTLHEIGHEFELSHHEYCVMYLLGSSYQRSFFCYNCINNIRWISYP